VELDGCVRNDRWRGRRLPRATSAAFALILQQTLLICCSDADQFGAARRAAGVVFGRGIALCLTIYLPLARFISLLPSAAFTLGMFLSYSVFFVTSYPGG
jgi:hypothetical protein